MDVFINRAFENGIQAFINKSEGKEYSLSHEFELGIVELLIHLHSKIDILNPYMIKNDDSLKDNLTIYGAKKEEVEKLFSLLNDYDVWFNSTDKHKNNIIEDIYKVLARLVVYKSNSINIPNEEMQYYRNFFALTNKRISQLVDMASINREGVVKALDRAIEENKFLQTQPKTENIFLDQALYAKYGIDFEDVKGLPKEKVIELNEEIKRRDESGNNGGVTKDKPKQLVLSSGNGFVDALVLFSIMCTEIMVGIVITVIIARM